MHRRQQDNVTMSEAARRYAVVLEKIGSDPSAFHDIIAKLRSDKSLKKADLDVIAMTCGGLTKAARNKAAAIAAIEKAFLAKAEAGTLRPFLPATWPM